MFQDEHREHCITRRLCRTIARAGSVIRGGRLVCLVTVLWLCLSSSQAWGQANPFALQPNPANYDSTLVAGDGSEILGSTFASWAQTALINNGSSAVYNATFLFQQCYGGGMLNDLNADLGSKVSWVGSSASTATQPSWSANNPNALEPWTSAVASQIASNPNQSVLTDVTNAAKNDTNGVNGSKLETGQIVYAGAPTQGVTFNYNLNEGGISGGPANGASNEVAVLWAGAPDPRHLQDINTMYNTLTKLWAGQNYTIYVMYDTAGNTPPAGAAWTNGTTAIGGHTETVTTMSATSTALQNLLTNTLAPGGSSAMTTSTQFLFYSSDHGGFDNRINNGLVTVPAYSDDTETDSYTLTANELASIKDSDAVPTLTITYYGLAKNATVSIQNVDGTFTLGTLMAGGTAMNPLTVTLNINPIDLALANTFIINNENDGSAFTIVSKSLYSGADDELYAGSVPEPSSLVLAAMGGLGTAVALGARRRRTRAAARSIA